MALIAKTFARSQWARRRLVSVACLILVLLSLFAWLRYQRQNLAHEAFGSGYVLIGAIVFLAAYNVRKRLPAIHWLGSSARWMQLHIYVALGSFGVFLVHAGMGIPEGVLERCLAAIYYIVFGSGLLGLYWSRTIPSRLTAVGEQVIFEQIPTLRREVAEQARALLFERPSQSIVLGRYYIRRLARFFERARPVSYLVNPNGTERRALLSEIEDLDRYLAPDHRESSRRLAQLVCRKDELDYHFALQGRLKIWLFLHIGLTYSLLIFATVHGITAIVFHGARP
jgi:hypothetical protein